MKKRTLIIAALLPLTLSACMNIDKRMFTAYKKVQTEYDPQINKNVTNFTSGLMCMDQLLMSPNVRYSSVLIENINDSTEQVKAGTRDMLISAISDMTTTNKKIKIIAYGSDSANMISFLKSAQQNQAYEQVPHYDIRGSISQYDQDIIQADNSFGFFGRGDKGGGFGKAKAASLDVMTLDLSVVRTADMSVVPGVTSKNTIAIYSKGNSLDADARIDKLGVYFDMTLSRSEGKSQALRNLIELAAIELIGKLTGVPYWTCLGTKSPQELRKEEQDRKEKEAKLAEEKRKEAERKAAEQKSAKEKAQSTVDSSDPDDDTHDADIYE